MANRFCSSCGAKLVSEAMFCVECGEAVPGTKALRAARPDWARRFAPLWVVLAVLAVSGAAVGIGVLNPTAPPRVPPRDAGPGESSDAPLPEGHPPIAIPEQVKQAIRDLATRAEAAPDDLDKWKQLGEVQYRAGMVDPSYLSAAEDSFKHVLERSPGNTDALRALGNIAFDQERPTVAVDYYTRYLEKKPDDREVRTDLGTMHLSSGNAGEAIRIYEEVLKSSPDFFQAQFNLGLARRSAGDQDGALAALAKARGMASDDKSRGQVDEVIARIKGAAAPAAPAAPGGSEGTAAAAGGAPAAAGSFKADVESVFRQNPIMGSKLQRIDWQGEESAKVFLRGFPMDQMGDEMRDMFLERLKGRVKEKKDAHRLTAATRIELVDADSNTVMATVTE